MSDRFNPPLSPNEEAVARKARPAKLLPILCLDFDGVLHGYQSGWQGAAIIPDPPVPGAVEFLHGAVERFQVAIFSSRSGQPGGIDAMRGWLMMHVMAAIDDRREAEHVLGLIQWPTEKPAAIVSIDDRAVTFTGRWPSLDEIAGFTPWNKRPATAPAAPEPAAGGEVPADWKLIPIEPTDGMQQDGLAALEAAIRTHGKPTLPGFAAAHVYQAMLAAAPALNTSGNGWQDNTILSRVKAQLEVAQSALIRIDRGGKSVREIAGKALLDIAMVPYPDEPPSTPTRADADAEGRRA